MYKRVQHIIALFLLCFGSMHVVAQKAMPDTVCIGSTKSYMVNPANPPGSIYKWWIDGVLQNEIKNAITITWNTTGRFKIEVREKLGVCDGVVLSGTVFVKSASVKDTFVTTCSSFTWNRTGVTYNTSGTYDFTFGNGVCVDTIRLKYISVVSSIQPSRYTTVNATANLPIQLQARIFTPTDQYAWLPAVGLNSYSISNPVFKYKRTTEYQVSITAGIGCIVVDTLLVKVFPASSQPAVASNIFVPKAFSPNGDGHNDQLVPLLFRIKDLYYFRVFNRWGQMVFETKTAGEGWDGTFKGLPSSPDIYTWTAAGIGNDGRTHNIRGQTVLFR